ncbi:hypothetical protein PM082_019162 [Marasmius tenuissimus]|nr:hypothetical protein PM082_019162 [Marasmius tenuissimus]
MVQMSYLRFVTSTEDSLSISLSALSSSRNPHWRIPPRPPTLFFAAADNPGFLVQLRLRPPLSESLPHTTPISLDVSNAAELERQVATHDLVISLIPYTYHADVIKAAIKGKTDSVVMTSSISSAMRELHPAAKEAGIIVLNEIGLDPGIDHLYAVKTIDEVHEQGGKVRYPPLKYYTHSEPFFPVDQEVLYLLQWPPLAPTRFQVPTPSATNSPSHPEVPSSITPPTSPTAKPSPSPATNSWAKPNPTTSLPPTLSSPTPTVTALPSANGTTSTGKVRAKPSSVVPSVTKVSPNSSKPSSISDGSTQPKKTGSSQTSSGNKSHPKSSVYLLRR